MSFLHDAYQSIRNILPGVKMAEDGHKHPAIVHKAQMPKYGMIIHDYKDTKVLPLTKNNVLPQVGAFNQGCLNLHKCVNNTGFSCTGNRSSESTIQRMYDHKLKPYAPENFDLKLPMHMAKYQ